MRKNLRGPPQHACGKWTAASRVRACCSPAISTPSRCAKAGSAIPFDGAIENGRLYGHGVMDMKAGLGSLIGGIMTLVESGVDFRGQDHVLPRSPTTWASRPAASTCFRRHKFDHCVLAELTDMQIYIAHRGRYYFDISTIGRSAHTCHKYHAINAIEKMLPVMEEISKLKYMPDIPQAMKELVGPELYTAVGRIYGGLFPGGPSMIPDRCTIRVDTRPQPGVPIEEVRAVIQAAIDRAKARDPEIEIEMVDADIKNSFMVDPNAPIVVALKSAWETTMGKPAKLSWRLLARRYGELRAIVRDRDLRSRWRAGLSAERIARAHRHRGRDAHLRADGGQHSSRGLSEAPIRDNDMAYMELRADEYVSLPARKLGEMVMDRRVSPVHLTELALASAKAAEPRINAYVSFLEPWAREIACEREQEARDGRMRSALHGVPIAVKDNFYLAGFPLARGSRTDPAYVPDATAPMVERLLDAGAVVIGKTTTPEFGWKGTGISPLTGVTRNPWNPERNSGGSSAGSAATVAAGAVAVSIGTDAGGSIRIPASFCGVPGFKPTLSRIPVWPGTVTEALSHAGPFGRFVDDISLTFALTEGPDSRDPMSYAATGPGDDARRQRLRAGTLRVGIIPAPFDIAPDPAVAHCVATAVAEITGKVRAQFSDATIDTPLPRDVFETFWVTGRGIGYGKLFAQHGTIMDPGLVRLGPLSATYSLEQYFQAINKRRAFNSIAFALFELDRSCVDADHAGRGL